MARGESEERRPEEEREQPPGAGMRVEIAGTAERQQPENVARTTPTRGPRASAPLMALAICLGLIALVFALWMWAGVP